MRKRPTAADVKALAAQLRREHELWPNLCHSLIEAKDRYVLMQWVIDEMDPVRVRVRKSIYTDRWCYHILSGPDEERPGYEAFAVLSRQAFPLRLKGVEGVEDIPEELRGPPDDASFQFLEYLHYYTTWACIDPTLRAKRQWHKPLPKEVWASTLPFGIFLTAAMVLESKPRALSRDARDEFCYRQWRLGTRWGEIADMANQRFEGKPWTTGEAAGAAARRFAKKHDLPLPDPRRGR